MVEVIYFGQDTAMNTLEGCEERLIHIAHHMLLQKIILSCISVEMIISVSKVEQCFPMHLR